MRLKGLRRENGVGASSSRIIAAFPVKIKIDRSGKLSQMISWVSCGSTCWNAWKFRSCPSFASFVARSVLDPLLMPPSPAFRRAQILRQWHRCGSAATSFGTNAGQSAARCLAALGARSTGVFGSSLVLWWATALSAGVPLARSGRRASSLSSQLCMISTCSHLQLTALAPLVNAFSVAVPYIFLPGLGGDGACAHME